MPHKVNSYLAVDKIHLLQVMAGDFIICFHTLCFQNEFGVPFSDVLVDHQHLEMPVWCIIVKRSLSEDFKRNRFFFDDGIVGYSYLPIDVKNFWSSLLSILKSCSSWAGKKS